MKYIFISVFQITILSTLVFLFLIFKSKIRFRFLYTDNILVIVSSALIGLCLFYLVSVTSLILVVIVNILLLLMVITCLILFRFYRDPVRHHNATDADILSPADGFITYIKKIQDNEIPFSIKGKTISKLEELTKVDILKTPCRLVGITMTLFDVHVNRAPISGRVILSKYHRGKFISLKKGGSTIENERNTIVIKNKTSTVGVIQIASKRVRGIKNFIRTEQKVHMGERIGRIDFGSQTDLIFSVDAEINVRVGQWVYGGETIIARLKVMD